MSYEIKTTASPLTKRNPAQPMMAAQENTAPAQTEMPPASQSTPPDRPKDAPSWLLPVLTELAGAISVRPGMFCQPNAEQINKIDDLIANLLIARDAAASMGVSALSASVAAASILGDIWKADEPINREVSTKIGKGLFELDRALGDFNLGGGKVTMDMLDKPVKSSETLHELRACVLAMMSQSAANTDAKETVDHFLSNMGSLALKSGIGTAIGEALSVADFYLSEQTRQGVEYHPWPEVAFYSIDHKNKLKLALAAQIVTSLNRYHRLDGNPDLQKLVAPDWKSYARHTAISAIGCANRAELCATQPETPLDSMMWQMTAMREGMAVHHVVEARFFAKMIELNGQNDGLIKAQAFSELPVVSERRGEWVNAIQDQIIGCVTRPELGNPAVAIKTRSAIVRGLLTINGTPKALNNCKYGLLSPGLTQDMLIPFVGAGGVASAADSIHTRLHELAERFGALAGGNITVTAGWERLLRDTAKNTLTVVGSSLVERIGRGEAIVPGDLIHQTHLAVTNAIQWASSLSNLPVPSDLMADIEFPAKAIDKQTSQVLN